MAFKLRPYQKQAVDATITHFRASDDPAVIVLPTGAGKSLVIAELARMAKQHIMVLTHVKELVEQNHAKYESYGTKAGIFSAGLKRKETEHQVTFASVQSLCPNLDKFQQAYSLLIIDECHRVDSNQVDEDSSNQYHQVIKHLSQLNPTLKILGLTATPYRLSQGWIYQYHHYGFVRSDQNKLFKHCIFELPLRLMIKQGYLTEPKLVDASIAEYDFSSVKVNNQGQYNNQQVNDLLARHPRVTQSIIEQVLQLAETRKAVMIFAATVQHAKEITSYLPDKNTALITGNTPLSERDNLIHQFKQQKLKYLVNVSVLTTGFDAPHVDFIAILRPTQSVSLYQQIVGRGLRLYKNKKDCLVIDYAGNGIDLYHPEVGSVKPNSDSVPVMIPCPLCQFGNTFWGKVDDNGHIIEHYGRRCWGITDETTKQQCQFRFKYKLCNQCNEENDIAAKYCQHCQHAIIDPDEQLKDALKLKNAMVIRCAELILESHSKANTLKLSYFDEEGLELNEYFDLSNKKQLKLFNQLYGKRHKQGTEPRTFSSVTSVLKAQNCLTKPDFVIAKQIKQKNKAAQQNKLWRVTERLFDYQGRYRKANQL